MHKVRQFFEDLVAQYGVDARSANWSGPATQAARFAVFRAYLDLQDCRVLDVGCGQGDLYAYLKEHQVPLGAYYGWDLAPNMIAVARARFPELTNNFCEQDLFFAPAEKGVFDWVLCSGSLNYGYDQASFAEAIRVMFRLARLGVAFNVLSTYADFMEAEYFYADPEETFRFCRTLTPWVNLIHSYMPHDFTMILKKERDDYLKQT
ncbi:MAG: class I SAM-dependent methyltransferase [Thermodesulfobacteriota bacterium]